MIARLTGKVAHKSTEHIILDVNGVGYQLFVPLSTYYELPDEGGDISLNTYLSVREDALTLYGFCSIDEKNIFMKLVSINGVGPKLGLGVLSGIAISDLINAIETHDIQKLTTIPGVGKKTAERMALELKDKIKGMEFVGVSRQESTVSLENRLNDDVISALTNLGYKQNTAEDALKAALKESDDISLEKLLKLSLNILSKSKR